LLERAELTFEPRRAFSEDVIEHRERIGRGRFVEPRHRVAEALLVLLAPACLLLFWDDPAPADVRSQPEDGIARLPLDDLLGGSIA
jgi:hypothetical protein